MFHLYTPSVLCAHLTNCRLHADRQGQLDARVPHEDIAFTAGLSKVSHACCLQQHLICSTDIMRTFNPQRDLRTLIKDFGSQKGTVQ